MANTITRPTEAQLAASYADLDLKLAAARATRNVSRRAKLMTEYKEARAKHDRAVAVFNHPAGRAAA